MVCRNRIWSDIRALARPQSIGRTLALLCLLSAVLAGAQTVTPTPTPSPTPTPIPQADLVASAFSFSPAQIDIGDTFSLPLSVANIGTAPANGGWTRFYASADPEITGSGNDILLQSQWVPNLDAGTTATFPTKNKFSTIVVNTVRVGADGRQVLAAGVYYMAAIVDAENQTKNESDENNVFIVPNATLRVGLASPKPAFNPIPDDGMTTVSITRDLRWTGAKAAYYDVYLAKVKDCGVDYERRDLYSPAESVQKVITLDANQDKHQDVVTAYNNNVDLFLNNADGTPTLSRVEVVKGVSEVTYVAAADLTHDTGEDGFRDNRQDFVVTSYLDDSIKPTPDFPNPTGSVYWVENTSADGDTTPSYTKHLIPLTKLVFNEQTQTTVPTVMAHMLGVNCVGTGDFDNDGDVDIVAGTTDTVGNDPLVFFFSDLNNKNNSDPANPPSPLPAFAPTPFPVWVNDVRDLAVVDVDQDGWLDIVLISEQSGVALLLKNETKNAGEGKFSFVSRYISTELKDPTTLAIGDLDRNGAPDVVVGDYIDNSIMWYRNDGTSMTQFTAHSVTTELPEVEAVAVTDMNGDQVPDVIASTALEDSIIWYASDGNVPPKFTAQVGASPSDRVSTFALSDLNEDGLNDMVCGSLFSNAFYWFMSIPQLDSRHLVSRNQLDLTYKPAMNLDFDTVYAWKVVSRTGSYEKTMRKPWSFRTQPTRIVPDVKILPAMAEHAGNLNVTYTLKNDGPTTPTRPYFIDSVYLSKDKKFSDDDVYIDARIMNTFGPKESRSFSINVSLARVQPPLAEGVYYIFAYSDRDESFTNHKYGDEIYMMANPLVVLDKPDKPSGPIPADKATGANAGLGLSWDQPEHARNYDVLLVKATSAQLAVTTTSISAAVPQAQAIAVADLDKDTSRTADVVCAFYNSGQGRIDWYRNNGTQAAFQGLPVGTLKNPSSVVVADFDRDGNVDVAASSYDQRQIAWFKNDGALVPTFTSGSVSTGNFLTSCLQAADLNGNGVPDLVSASFQGTGLAWHENRNGTPLKFIDRIIDNTSGMASYVVPADINGDGREDLLASFWNPSSLAWYENTGGFPVHFTRHVVSTEIDEPRALAMADMDGDGDLDILCVADHGDRVVWFQNDGALEPKFTPNVVDAVLDSPRSVLPVDFNHDGLIDIVVASAGNHLVEWYRNDGNKPLTFTHFTIDASVVGQQAMAVTAADMDLDSYPDVICASTGTAGGQLSWYQYGLAFTYGNPLATVAHGLTKPEYIPPKALEPAWGYQWQVVNRNYVLTADNKTTFTRETAGPIWSFVTGQPDLTASNVTIAPAAITQGQPFQVNFTEANIGKSDAWTGQWVQVWASPDQLVTRSGNDILVGKVWSNLVKAGDVQDLTVTIDTANVGPNFNQLLSTGTYTIAVFVDATNGVPYESNEANRFLATQKLVVDPKNEVGGRWERYQ